MVGTHGFLQFRDRFTALPGIHRGKPFGLRPECRIGELFLLRFKLGARRRDVIAVAEHAQVFLQCANAGAAGWLIFDLLIPHIRGLVTAAVGFGHILQHGKAFITAAALEQELRERRLLLGIAGTAGIDLLQLVNGGITPGRIFGDNGPVLCG